MPYRAAPQPAAGRRELADHPVAPAPFLTGDVAPPWREHGRGLPRRDFFAAIVERLRSDLPAARRDFRHKANTLLLKVYFDNERVHYEVWVDGERQTIEIGLHFEDGPVSTAAFLAYFDDLIVELKHDLGPAIELERWTASWGHLYEHWPLAPLSDALAARVAGRLAQLIVALQPLVEAADVPAERALESAGSQRREAWRRWRR